MKKVLIIDVRPELTKPQLAYDTWLSYMRTVLIFPAISPQEQKGITELFFLSQAEALKEMTQTERDEYHKMIAPKI